MKNQFKKLITSPMIITAIIAFVATIVAAIIGIIPLLPAKLPAPLPTGRPSPTPMPTVVGTPINIGADIAASGPMGFMVNVYDVSLIVDEVIAYQTASNGISERPGYTFLLVKLRIANQNPQIFIWARDDILVVDDYSNEYRTWGDLFSDFPDIISVSCNESVVGALVYRIPVAALNNNLILRLETVSYDVKPLTIRIEIPLGKITQQP
jgi:hypothetical protein